MSIRRAWSVTTADLLQTRDPEELARFDREREEQVRPDVGERQLGVRVRYHAEHVLVLGPVERTVHERVEPPEPNGTERCRHPEPAGASVVASLVCVEQRLEQRDGALVGR